MELSIIVPVYNEGKLVHQAIASIDEVISKHFNSYEVIFVDDGSKDTSFDELVILAKGRSHVRVLSMASNVGSHMAIRAGLDHCKGDLITFLACDLQESPDVVVQLKEAMDAQTDIVWAVRNSRADGFFSELLSNSFYWLARRIVSKNIPPKGASIFLINQKVLQTLNKYRERNLTLEGLFATIGYSRKYVMYDRLERTEGVSKWTLAKKMKLFIDFFVAYSYAPIRMVSVVGIVFAISGFLYALYLIVRHLIWHDLSPGWPALISVLLIGFGITNISLGIIAEYLWRTLDEARHRPLYNIQHKINID